MTAAPLMDTTKTRTMNTACINGPFPQKKRRAGRRSEHRGTLPPLVRRRKELSSQPAADGERQDEDRDSREDGGDDIHSGHCSSPKVRKLPRVSNASPPKDIIAH